MADLVAALGLVLVLEGVTFAAFPGAARRAMTVLLEAPEGSLRAAGVASAVAGVILVWLVRG
jgi:uncharacterized protein YjeT (DUF2065 family)